MVDIEVKNDISREVSPSPTLSNTTKTASILMIQPLENINKELLYRQRQNRPFKIIQNLPINKNNSQLPDYSLLNNPLSIKDSSVLYNSLIVSRFNWINHIFKTYWTRREQIIRGLDLNKKDKMVRFCNPLLICGDVHTFKIKLFFLKDDEKEKLFKLDLEKRKEDRIKRKLEKQEELQRRKEEREREEKEREEKEREEKEREEKEREEKEREEKEREKKIEEQKTEHKIEDEKLIINTPKQLENTTSSNEIIKPSKEQSISLESKIVNDDLKSKESNLTIDNSNLSTNQKSTTLTENTLEVESLKKPCEKENQKASTLQIENNITIENSTKSENKNIVEENKNIEENKNLLEENKDTKTNQSNESKSVISSTPPVSSTPKSKTKADAKDIMANPESAIMIQNLNVLAKQDPHLNGLMKTVASGSASNEQIMEFQKYIQKAKQMGDVTGYMQKLKFKQQKDKKEINLSSNISNKLDESGKSKEEIQMEKQRLKEERQKKKRERELHKQKLAMENSNSSSLTPKLQLLTPEEIKKKEDDLLKRAMEMKHEQERQRIEKIRLKEEKEREKLRIKEEKQERKSKEREEKELQKKLAREEREQERDRQKQKKLAEKEKARIEREKKIKERQLQKEREKLDSKMKNDISKKQRNYDGDTTINNNNNKNIIDDDNDYNDEDDRMGKLNNADDDDDDDLWNDKLSPLQERYTTGASLVFEFLENPSSRFTIPRDTIYELIDNEDEDDNNELNLNSTIEGNQNFKIKSENCTGNNSRPKSPYVTLLASFLLVHNQGEIDGWERRQAEARAIEEEKERKRLEALKIEEEESKKNTIAENARKRRRKKSTWNSSSSKRATRLSKQAKEIELLRREEEGFHEEDAHLRDNEKEEDIRPIPIYSCVTLKLCNVPFRFANFILQSGNSMEDRKKNMEEIMKIGTKVSLDQLWYQIDGIKDEILGETLRYNLNRLDYSACGGKKYKTMFYKKFGKGGR
ncbi:SWR1-complex protein 3 [Pichia californica]|nr:SWR1-complex protein 3 [[Candida] californica]